MQQSKNVDPFNGSFKDLLAQDSAEVHSSRGIAKDPEGTFLSALNDAMPLASAVSESLNRTAEAVQAFVLSVIALRAMIWADGKPDFNARTQAARDAVVPLIDASRSSAERAAGDKGRERAKDRLQKSVARALPRVVLSWLQKNQGLTLDAKQQDRVLSLWDEGKGSKDAEIGPAIDLLREYLPTSWDAKQRAAETKRRKAADAKVPAETDEQKQQREGRDIVLALPSAVAAVSMDVAVAELEAAVAVLVIALRSGEQVHFGKGRGPVGEGFGRIAFLAGIGRKVTDEQDLTPEEKLLVGAITKQPEQPEPEKQPEPEQKQQQQRKQRVRPVRKQQQQRKQQKQQQQRSSRARTARKQPVRK